MDAKTSGEADHQTSDVRSMAQPPFAEFLGVRVIHISRERVAAELTVREELGNRFGILHGGAIMALADNLGGTATIANLPENATTTTIESKTNFFAGISVGDTAHAECTPLHRGRSTMVWQTRITRGDGKLAAIVTQTQMVLMGRK
jgi:1,4-dihydroxy-2-naphthoyl-CoA hydrolase